MNKFIVLILLAISGTVSAQLNTTLRDNLTYDTGVNDIWGYVAPDGTEYAIVGLVDGVSFVSLADPDNVVEVAKIEGDFSSWRDMKTYGEYAYSVADQGSSTEGITAFNLSELPDRVTFNRTTYNVPGSNTRFARAHNLYIDTTTGILFTAGGDRNIRDGGMIMFDLKQTPMTPELIAVGPPKYSHDVFVLNDTMYGSEIYSGELALYDISDLDTITEIGRTSTPFNFTHNAWTTDNGRYVFTTDEKENASVAVYDLADKNDIKLLDEYRPVGSLNTGTIPHNAHVIGDYVSISYYTDGLRVIDASVPSNVIEVANYDTYLGPDGDFNGCWGAYPYLPSGLTLASDRQTGLYVIEVDYKKAARIEGTLTDRAGGFPLNAVDVSIMSPEEQAEMSDATGDYATGLANGGTYTVTFRKSGYNPLSVEVEFINGQTIRLDTTLQASTLISVDYTVVDDRDGTPIQGARVQLSGELDSYNLRTDNQGVASTDGVPDIEVFDVVVTGWGYRAVVGSGVSATNLSGTVIRLKAGYQDDFVSNLGWRITSAANTGNWERAEPIGTTFRDSVSAPAGDVAGDIGKLAYVTGNSAGAAGTNDVDNGIARFESPLFQPVIDNAKDVLVRYSYWFANLGGEDVAPNDTLKITITNGKDSVVARTYTGNPGAWVQDSFLVTEYLSLTDSLKLIIETADFTESGHIVEAGFDAFSTLDIERSTSTETFSNELVEALLYPNPSQGQFTLRYDARGTVSTDLKIYDATGRLISSRRLNGNTGSIRLGGELPKGFYLIELSANNERLWVGKGIKE